MKEKNTTKKKTETAIKVKDIDAKANPTGGHRRNSSEAASVTGKPIRRAS